MRDIEAIAVQVQRENPSVNAEQLVVRHSGADDDGLWFFRNPKTGVEIQLESSTGNCPFLVESSSSGDRAVASSIQQAIALVVAGLGLHGPAA